ncbi:alpha-glucosidase [Curvibacter sp. APW13]|uniref:alpha-glucosidase n=1 Tax=Curvibacter sp. APW13 TaxID=3077236 RepID=UPI0028DEEBB9|nr:alpha-glucosidase [Curvibacter sp. APW13]MDT8990492.1 alpha-glucosidase [Curvibacter sp. APW13]
MKKILGTLAVASLVGAGLYCVNGPLATAQAPYAHLELAPGLAGTSYALGGYRVMLDGSAQPRLRIMRNGQAHAVFENIPGRAFVAAGRGRDEFHEARGMVRVDTTTPVRCTDQRIDTVQSDAGQFVLGGVLQCLDGPQPYRMRLHGGAGTHLAFSVELLPRQDAQAAPYNRVLLVAASSADEGIYGFGEQFSYFNQKGRLLPILVSEQGVGRGLQPITFAADLTNNGAGGKWHTSYAGVPHFITTAQRGLLLDTHDYVEFDMRRAESTVVELHGTQLSGHFLAGNSPLELVTASTELTGRMRPLPEWVTQGAIIGLQGGTAKVREALAQLQAQKTPLAAFWLQDWVGQRITTFGKQLWWNWTVDEKRYPGWDALVADLKKDRISVMTYVNPFLADVEMRRDEQGAGYRNLFAEAQAKGYLVKKADGSPYLILNTSFSAGLLDLTNPEAWKWMKDVIKKEVIARGSAGWMADFGEGFPMDGVTHAKVDPVQHHNAYPELWAQLNREAIAEAGVGTTATFFSRSGYTRSPAQSTLFWLGDQLVTWDAHDGLKTAVTGLLSSGISGYAFNHSDIGGYTTITSPIKNYHRSKELFLRWTELAAFNTVFRTHQGNRPDDNWQFNSDAETLAHFARMAQVYACWEPYRRTLIAEAATKGWPVVRHPYLHYPQEAAFRSMDSAQFMVGADFMVAPVLDPGVKAVRVTLPKGDWVDLWSGQPVTSGWLKEVAAPLGRPPVFYRAGSASGEQLRGCLKHRQLL